MLQDALLDLTHRGDILPGPCKGIASLFARKADNAAAKDSSAAPLFDHANLRGPGYYH